MNTQENMTNAVNCYISKNNLTHDVFASRAGLSKEALRAKLYNRRRWSLDEAVRLAELGVHVPIVNTKE